MGNEILWLHLVSQEDDLSSVAPCLALRAYKLLEAFLLQQACQMISSSCGPQP